MAFSQENIDRAWSRASGRCECTLKVCEHYGKCNKELDPQNKAPEKEWEAHHIVSQDAGGPDSLDNCQILCVKCHKNTRSYGGR